MRSDTWQGISDAVSGNIVKASGPILSVGTGDSIAFCSTRFLKYPRAVVIMQLVVWCCTVLGPLRTTLPTLWDYCAYNRERAFIF